MPHHYSFQPTSPFPTMSKENEKEEVFIENKATRADTLDAIPEIGTPERILAERKLVRKLDMRLLPTIILIYIMNYIDVSSTFYVLATSQTHL
jgi:hypothetical protein